MKLRLKDKRLPPVQLRLAVPAAVKEMLDDYVCFVRGASGREVDAREVAVEMLAQFMESDRDFKQFQKRGQMTELPRRLGGVQKAVQVNGQASA
jgi:hypothetical protein